MDAATGIRRCRVAGRAAVLVTVAGLAWSVGGAAEKPSTPPASAGNVEQTARACLRSGLDWLKDKQKGDGSWSNPNYPAVTALGLWAFARSRHPDRTAVCSNAAAFVTGFVQEDGGIYKPAGLGRGSGGLSTYNTAICMVALHAYDREKYTPVILGAREFVAGSQLVGDSPGAGGFGYDRDPPVVARVVSKLTGRSRADLSNTGWALQAMRLTQDVEDLRPGGRRVDVDWRASLDFLKKLQNQDRTDAGHYGGFGYESGGSRGGTVAGDKDGVVRLRGYGSMTYAGLESMIYAQVDPRDARVRSALDWASRHWSVDENPGMGTRGLFYYYNIMAKALSLTGADTLSRVSGGAIPWKKELVEKLAAIRQPDGCWVNPDNTFWEADSVLVTCYAALALEYALGW